MGDCNKKKEDKCLRKSNILVYQQPTGQRTERRLEDCKGKIKVPICSPKAKPIKVCTGAELRKMCPPKVCPCEPVKKRTFGLTKLFGFGLKSAIAAAAVYITYDMGIWGTTDDTQQLYGMACSIFGSPQPKKNDKWDPPSCEAESEFFHKPPFDPYGHCDQPPIQAEQTYDKFKHLWNGAISFIFHGLAKFPDNVMGKKEKAEAMKAESADEKAECVSYSHLNEEEIEELKNEYK